MKHTQHRSKQRKQSHFPEWFTELKIPATLRSRLTGHFYIAIRGYQKWYKKRVHTFAAKSVPPDQVEAIWFARKAILDKQEADTPAPMSDNHRTYRMALGEFLASRKIRIGAHVRSMSERTFDNYCGALNAFGRFVPEGRSESIADMLLAEIGPAEFSAYAKKFIHWKPSGFDSIVSRVSALFYWAVEMEYIGKYRPGPDFLRPGKQEIRDHRVGKTLGFTVDEVAKLYSSVSPLLKMWVALGMCASFINSDVANMTRSVIDLNTGIIDYRRRKTGKIRRIIPLPDDVLALLKSYIRPDPAEERYGDHFFLSQNGRPYSVPKNENGKPTCTMSTMVRRAMMAAGLKSDNDGKGFKSLRTTFYNLAPGGEWDIENRIIRGRAQGTVDLDSYLEGVNLDRLRHVVNHVWGQVKAKIEV